MINCLLPDGKINPLRLTEVLYVPSLNHNLFSWNSCHSKGYRWEAIDSHVYLYNRNTTLILTAEFHRNLSYIVEALHHALVTFPSTKSSMYWHSALGHPSPFKLSAQSYQDGNLIPKIPFDFECMTRIQAKPVHSVPPPPAQWS